MPAGLIEEHHGMGVGGGVGDLGEVRGHGGRVAAGHDDRPTLSLLRTDGAEDTGRGGALDAEGRVPRPAHHRVIPLLTLRAPYRHWPTRGSS